jgi:ABC-type multidrug transport system ATPase subunit
VCLSSHLLAEIEQVCSHVAVMRLGKLLTQSSLSELRGTTVTRLRITSTDPAKVVELLRARGIQATEEKGGMVIAIPEHHQPEDINKALVEAGIGVKGLTSETPTLEDIFVNLTGEGFDVAQ